MNIDKTFGIIFLVIIFSMIGSLTGKAVYGQESELEWTSFEDAIKIAEQHQKLIMVDVWAPWCGWCKKMQKEVYPKLSLSLNKNFVLTRLNRDDNETKKEYHNSSLSPLRIAQKLNVQNVPAIVFLSPKSDYLFHISGFVDIEELSSILKYAVTMPTNIGTVSGK